MSSRSLMTAGYCETSVRAAFSSVSRSSVSVSRSNCQIAGRGETATGIATPHPHPAPPRAAPIRESRSPRLAAPRTTKRARRRARVARPRFTARRRRFGARDAAAAAATGRSSFGAARVWTRTHRVELLFELRLFALLLSAPSIPQHAARRHAVRQRAASRVRAATRGAEAPSARRATDG